MIHQHVGNLLDIERGILVHGCNCYGQMGSGIAGAIHGKWPEVFEAYSEHDNAIGLSLGDVIFVAGREKIVFGEFKYNDVAARHIHNFTKQLPSGLIIANAMTQYDYGRDPNVVYVDYDAISAAFARIKILARDTGLPVHFPLIGCGLANGKWEEVAPRIESALGDSVEKHLWTLPTK